VKTFYGTKLLLWLAMYGVLMGWVEAATSNRVMYYTISIVRMLPHNTDSFTQGLLYYDGMLYESTGLYGRSTLQQVDAVSGIVQRSMPVPEVFAEGLVRWGNRLIQLTWKENTALIYNITDFSRLGEFRYNTEGWGLTADERSLIMSDGSDTLYFRDPLSFEVVRTVRVTLNNAPLFRINELEYIDGLIYANIWGEDMIAQIDPNTGQVRGMIDARPLRRMQPTLKRDNVLNGIAYNPELSTIYLTGKNWPTLFEVTLEQGF
jgi:glutamine cyclotransferase